MMLPPWNLSPPARRNYQHPITPNSLALEIFIVSMERNVAVVVAVLRLNANAQTVCSTAVTPTGVCFPRAMMEVLMQDVACDFGDSLLKTCRVCLYYALITGNIHV